MGHSIRRPPRLATTLLTWLVPHDECEFVLGDLVEQYNARARSSPLAALSWYWGQVLRSCVTFRLTRRHKPKLENTESQNMGRAILSDVRYAIRSLRRAPGFSLIAILTLAIGIGANTAIFSVVDAVVLRRLPFENPHQLMRVYLLMPPPTPGEAPLDMFWSYPKYQTLVETQDIFESLAMFLPVRYTMTGGNNAERIGGEVVGAGYFDLLGIRARLGRAFLAEEDVSPGTHYVAVLSNDLWIRRFASDPEVTGKSIRLNGVTYTIVGVMPAGFRGLSGAAEFFVPTMTLSTGTITNPGAHAQNVIGRLRDGVSLSQVRLAMPAIGARIDEAFPGASASAHWSAHARTLEDVRAEPVIKTSLLLLLGAVGFVLLIACVNLANLLLGRAATRQREMAIRLSVGASRGRIVRQLLTESTVLTALGGAAGLALAFPSVGFLRRIAPQASGAFAEDVSGLTQMGMEAIRVDGVTLLFTLGITLLTGVIFGLVPAIVTSRPDLTSALKEGGVAGQRRSASLRVGAREALVVAELALAFVLLVGSGLMIKSFAQLQETDMGFDPDNVLTLSLSFPFAQYDRPAGQQRLEELHERIRSLPGVESVGFNICTPLSSGCNGAPIWFPDRPASDPARRAVVAIHFVSPEYFRTLGIPITRGMAFTPQDRAGSHGVALIDEEAARLFWPDADPIGRMIGVGQGDQGNREVVGVVGNVRYDAVDDAPFPTVYIPFLQSIRRSGFTLVRASVEPTSLIPAIRQIVRNIDPDLPLFDVKTMNVRLGEATSSARFSALLLTTYSSIALILAAIGIYGVLSYAVAQRTHEIGLRLALGAERFSILKLVVGRALAMALVGLGMGLLTAWGLTRVFAAILYEVRPDDPATFGIVAITLTALALIASYVPAHRASRVDPMIALRRE